MFEKITFCPVCNSNENKSYLVAKDHLLTNESFAISKCSQCGFLFTNPRPTKDNLNSYYKSDQYISHSDKIQSISDFIYKIVRKYTLYQKEKLILKFAKQKSILDYGCGTGDFLLTCIKKGWEIYGFEPSNEARKIAELKTKSEIYSNPVQLQQLSNISITSLWHVLEHVPDLNDTLLQLKNALSNNGKMIIAVPNHNSYDAAIYKEYWAAYDVPRHLYHFNQMTMKKLMEKHKLKIKEILPMKFDSYYVSLLSEKYRFGKENYINSIITGYKSNRYANLNNNNYSSLIYIVSK